MVSHDLLRRDVRMLGEMLGDTIRLVVGDESLALVEEIRHLSRERRSGEQDADQRLAQRIAELSESQARVVARAFSVFFDMANLAEDRHRVRVLRGREAERYPQPLGESLAAGVNRLKDAGFSAVEVQQALDCLNIELVLTAHPSEAKRRSIRAKLRRMRQHLQELDRADLLPRERARMSDGLRAELAVIWETDFLRAWRPTVLQEVERGLSILPRLCEVIPLVYDALRGALTMAYPEHTFQIPTFLRFGSWMGGDRDGNPNVTADVTAQTLVWLRDAAVTQHLASCQRMMDFFSISDREMPADDNLKAQIKSAAVQWPGLALRLKTVGPLEVYRRWLTMIQWRLEQSRGDKLLAALPAGGYRDGNQLAADLVVMCDSLCNHHGELLVQSQLQRWVDLVKVFGLHSTRLDVRQGAPRYHAVLNEIFAALKLADNLVGMPEAERQAVLAGSLSWRGTFAEEQLSAAAQETLQLFRLLRGAIQSYGSDVIGGHVISLTRQPSDVLAVLWLWRWAQAEAGDFTVPGEVPELKIIPLFEKIEDLRNAAATLEAILSQPAYLDHLRRQGSRQVVMVGYSDSTKDGGYLAACWGLCQAQSDLHRVAEKFDVKLTFFHGRGGSLGRGGGPAARGIFSLPPESLDGSLRLTEQGEVLAERYDDPQVAYRHLEQVGYATLLASALPTVPAKPQWISVMDELSRRSLAAYRELVDQPGFMQFFSVATPIEEIENLPIGSRPAHRGGERTLDDLRAIPWVFAWTQNRCMIPAWYGLGAGLDSLAADDMQSLTTAREMYREWPFFQATIDNAALALAKADMSIARRYAELVDDADIRQRLWKLISEECDRTRQAVVRLVGGTELMSATPWLQSSIDVRNPYIDPINLIQIELLKRRRAITETAAVEEQERLRDQLRLTVQGIAAGMRTTG